MNALTGRRILLVEDEFIVAETVADMLRDLGAEVVGPAARLASGMQLAKTEQFDAAVLDINLAGERSDAIADLLDALEIPYILATGYGKLADRGGGVRVLEKPYTEDGLLDALSRALEHRP